MLSGLTHSEWNHKQKCKFVANYKPYNYRYPLFQRGNPQMRIFLPNFWMKLVRLDHETHSKNHVTFQVSSEMSRLDVKNYLENIYKVPVMSIKTYNQIGKVHPPHLEENEIYKDDDVKIAYVILVSKKVLNLDTPKKIYELTFLSRKMYN